MLFAYEEIEFTTMKKIFILLIVFLSLGVRAQNSIYDFTVRDIDGRDYAFSQLRGKKIVIVK